MDFSSSPAHLDPPNWNQQLHPGQLPSVAPVDASHQQHQLPPMWPLMAPQLGAATSASEGGSWARPGSATPGAGSTSVRPGSMAERARLAKIPLPEPGLKCPRCDSTNTKFCYYNNYSIFQARYFCKACRRYWTRDGALRDVPVGGVCRRNKRKKPSKHSSSSSSTSASASATTSSATVAPSSAAADVMPAAPQLQLAFGSLHPLWSDRYGGIGASRLGFSGLSSSLHPAVDYQLGDGLGLDRWRLLPPAQQFPFLSPADTVTPPLPAAQQFPFLSPADTVTPPLPGLSLMSSGSYTFEDAEAGNVAVAANLAGQMPASASMAASGVLITQMASVKMDDNPTTAATRQFCGIGDNGAGGYGGNAADGGPGVAAPGGAWSDLSAFNSPC